MYIVQLTENCKEKSSIFAALQTPTLFRLSLVQFSVNDTLDAVNTTVYSVLDHLSPLLFY